MSSKTSKPQNKKDGKVRKLEDLPAEIQVLVEHYYARFRAEVANEQNLASAKKWIMKQLKNPMTYDIALFLLPGAFAPKARLGKVALQLAPNALALIARKVEIKYGDHHKAKKAPKKNKKKK